MEQESITNFKKASYFSIINLLKKSVSVGVALTYFLI